MTFDPLRAVCMVIFIYAMAVGNHTVALIALAVTTFVQLEARLR